ncbi:MAG: hypothetical protein LUG46_05825 [Erysipelotrichaceae bacterium]|nr:hypothetical protein [Erysipelotrichaceae bacterium]
MIKAISEAQNMIYEMSRKSQIVKDIMAKKLEFISDPRNRYISYNHAMDLRAKYYDGKVEGKDEEREIQRQKMQDVVIEHYAPKYKGDISWLDNLSIEEYLYIENMMFHDATLKELKNYVESVKQ